MRRWVEWERFERERLAADLMGDMNNMALVASKKGLPLKPFDTETYVTAAVEQAENQSLAKERERMNRTMNNRSADRQAFTPTRMPARESWIANAGQTVSLEMTSAPQARPLR